MVPRKPLRPKFVTAQHEGIDFPTDPLLFFRQQSRQLFECNARVPRDHHQVQITGLALLAAREGTECEGHDNAILDRPQRLPQSIAHAHRSHDHLLKRLVDRRIRIRSEEAILLAPHNSARCELPQLSLNRADSASGSPDDFSEVKRLVWPRE
jgi:hypothetical protein